jgi:hypothetical protein
MRGARTQTVNVNAMPTTKGDPMPQCPVCGREDEVVSVAIHLIDQHTWDYEQAQEWMREQEETCERRRRKARRV